MRKKNTRQDPKMSGKITFFKDQRNKQYAEKRKDSKEKCFEPQHITVVQCWTEGRSSTAVAEDLRPTATATVAEV